MAGKGKPLYILLVVAVVLCTQLVSTAWAGPLPGAIFTTDVNGDRVNMNIYPDKYAVYLDGGPGPNAPSTAAALSEGSYYFQVTGPDGKVLLSQDPVGARKVHVNAYGVFDFVYPYFVKRGNQWVNIAHQTGIDIDHQELGAITVQLMPYANTPNNGGVYKVWVTPCDRFVGDPTKVDNPLYVHGFIHAWSKTDNYKVKGRIIPPVIYVKKFDDSNVNGVWDSNEPEITGWAVNVTDPLTVVNTVYTPATFLAVPSGLWTTTEDTPAGWQQTAVYIDGVLQPLSPTVTVNVAGTSGETHTVIYGNVQLGKIRACKFYDANGNGVCDPNESCVPGIKIVLTGVAVNGTVVGPLVCYTDSTGWCEWDGLLPGNYTVTEIVPPGWTPTTPVSVGISLPEGGDESVSFGNFCVGTAAFGTKGYWHNKNGLQETVQADFDFLNSLAPWLAPSSYFGDGDEPINGYFANGDPVSAAWDDGTLIWAAGTAWAEQSHFLVDSNGGGDPREQLAQQLDAFIMNTRHRLDGTSCAIQVNGSWVSASDLINQAVSVWLSGSASEQNAMEGLLDGLNNNLAVGFIHCQPCPVVYP